MEQPKHLRVKYQQTNAVFVTKNFSKKLPKFNGALGSNNSRICDCFWQIAFLLLARVEQYLRAEMRSFMDTTHMRWLEKATSVIFPSWSLTLRIHPLLSAWSTVWKDKRWARLYTRRAAVGHSTSPEKACTARTQSCSMPRHGWAHSGLRPDDPSLLWERSRDVWHNTTDSVPYSRNYPYIIYIDDLHSGTFGMQCLQIKCPVNQLHSPVSKYLYPQLHCIQINIKHSEI